MNKWIRELFSEQETRGWKTEKFINQKSIAQSQYAIN